MSDDKASAHEIKADTKNIYTDDAIDPIYQAKGHILNDALQEIGMGKYQVCNHVCRDFLDL